MKVTALFFIISFSLNAASAPVFTLILKRPYDKFWYQVHEEKGKWICKTSSYPHFVASENPLKTMDWSGLKKEAKSMDKNCKLTVGMTQEISDKKNETIVTCAQQPQTHALLKKLSTLCRSKI